MEIIHQLSEIVPVSCAHRWDQCHLLIDNKYDHKPDLYLNYAHDTTDRDSIGWHVIHM